MTQKAILLLEDGTYFEGESKGSTTTKTGELCFNTGMTGYQELFTDPSYYGQLLIMTSNHIGNYGTKDEDNEHSKTSISGMICREYNEKPSRNLSDQSLNDFLIQNEVPVIKGIDTRSLVKLIRKKGSLNAILSTETTDIDLLTKKLSQAPKMNGLELASIVTTKQKYTLGNPNSKYRIAVYDYGVKANILNNFIDRDCFLEIYPAKTPLAEVLLSNPHGIFLANGPGDPASMDYAIENTRLILEKNIPLFGICLGHQILALALGAKTYKLHNGHRGINHPVKNLKTNQCEITSQNHGFGVDKNSIGALKDVEITHVNLNDDTIEGIKIKNKPVFSVQYHPESSPGPQDSAYLFDDFLNLMKI